MSVSFTGRLVMGLPQHEVGSFKTGIRVQQIAPIGLANLIDNPYVVGIVDGKLRLSLTPDGPPLTDLDGNPRDYPPGRFFPILETAH
jgi:hypothetical protein